MKANNLKVLGLALGCLAAVSGQAAISNIGFENGNLNDWSVNLPVIDTLSPNYLPGDSGTASVAVNDALFSGTIGGFVYSYNFSAPAGQNFLSLSLANGDPYSVSVSQTFTLQQGDNLKIWGAIDVPLKFGPVAAWSLKDQGGNTVASWSSTTIVTMNPSSSPVNGTEHSDWIPQSLSIPSNGDYTLEFSINQDIGDRFKGYFDVQYTPVPEPTTWLAGGITGLMAGFSFFAQNRRQKSTRLKG